MRNEEPNSALRKHQTVVNRKSEFVNLFAIAIATLLSASAGAVDIVAHRGASFDAPENTVASAKLGWQQEADAVEIDIHLSKDGRIVVLHDADTKRTTAVVGKAAETSSADLR